MLLYCNQLGFHEYLGKTYNETKRRPIFIARERIGFDEDFL